MMERRSGRAEDVAAIVLAAGKSRRMRSDLPKVLHTIAGRPMLSYVLQACRDVGIGRIVVVVGHHKELLREAFAHDPRIEWVEQAEQLGTGHAVMMCEPTLCDFEGDVVVVAGDMPLLRAETLDRLLQAHRSDHASASLATTELENPSGCGRIVRDARGKLHRIVEEAECSEAQKDIREVNISYYCFERRALFDALRRVRPHNAKGEYYLTEALHILIADGRPCTIVAGVTPGDALGVNSPEDLARVEEVMRQRCTKLQTN